MATVTLHAGRAQSLTIAESGTISDVWSFDAGHVFGMMGILIQSPATLTGTVTVEVATATGGTYYPLQSNGVDVVVTATKCMVLWPVLAGALRLVSDTPEVSARTFNVLAHAHDSVM